MDSQFESFIFKKILSEDFHMSDNDIDHTIMLERLVREHKRDVDFFYQAVK